MSENNGEMRVIEINGVKLEIDLRTAKRIDTLRVGTKVKVLKRKWGDAYDVLPGVIVGFEPFENLPTIVIATIDAGSSPAPTIEMLTYNAQTKDVEIVASIDDVLVERAKIEALFDRQVAKLRNEIEQIEERRAYFERNFAAYWGEVKGAEVEIA